MRDTVFLDIYFCHRRVSLCNFYTAKVSYCFKVRYVKSSYFGKVGAGAEMSNTPFIDFDVPSNGMIA